jgi:hypothetical protein
LISHHPAIDAVALAHRAALLASAAIVLALLPALFAPVASAASKPQCAVTRPFDNATVSGKLRVTGTADMATDPIIRVQLRIDGGSLLIANGTTSWYFDLDTTLLSNGPHTIEAKSFDGTQYSDPASVSFTVRNTKSEAPKGEPPYYLAAIAIILVSGVAVAAWRMKAMGKG